MSLTPQRVLEFELELQSKLLRELGEKDTKAMNDAWSFACESYSFRDEVDRLCVKRMFMMGFISGLDYYNKLVKEIIE